MIFKAVEAMVHSRAAALLAYLITFCAGLAWLQFRQQAQLTREEVFVVGWALTAAKEGIEYVAQRVFARRRCRDYIDGIKALLRSIETRPDKVTVPELHRQLTSFARFVGDLKAFDQQVILDDLVARLALLPNANNSATFADIFPERLPPFVSDVQLALKEIENVRH